MSEARGMDAAWQRLSRWAVLHFAAGSLIALSRSAWALVPVAYGAIQLESGWFVMLLAAFVSAILVFAMLSYQRFSYRLGDQQVEVRRGILSRSQVSLDFSRVQSVDMARPFYLRPLDLVSLKIDSAGSSEDEIELAALQEGEAKAIREYVLARKNSGAAEVVSAPETLALDEEVPPDLTRGLGDLVVHGLSDNRVLLVAAAVLGFIGQTPLDLEQAIETQAPSLAGAASDLAGPALLIAVAAGLFSLFALLMSLSVLRTIVVFFGYSLWDLGDRIRLRHGLLTEREVNVEKSRIQAASWEQRWVHRLFGRYDLQLLAVGGFSDAGVSRAKLMVPAVEPAQALTLSRYWSAVPDVAAAPFSSINWRYAAWRIVPLTFLSGALLALALQADHPVSRSLLFVLIPVIWTLVSICVYASFKRWGVAVIGDWVVLRRGLVGVSYSLIPAFKLQTVRLSTTPFLKRAGLCHLHLSVAARSFRVPYIPVSMARNIARLCLYEVEATDRSWM